MTFADLIRQRVEAGRGTADGPFLDILHELAEGLTLTKRIGAAITHGVRGKHYLTLWPRSHPAKRRMVLAFWVSPHSIVIFTEPRQEFADVDNLRNWLVDFVVRPKFLEGIEALEELAREPAEGYLRAQVIGQFTHNDVAVEIDPNVQSALVEQDEGSHVDITVRHGPTPGAFDPQRSYVALESSGVRVENLRVETLADGAIRIRGIKYLDPDLQADVKQEAPYLSI